MTKETTKIYFALVPNFTPIMSRHISKEVSKMTKKFLV